MKKYLTAAVLAVVALGLSAAPAFGTSCSPVNKPVDAGANAGTVTVTLSPTGPPTVVVTPNLNPAGHATGGFMTVSVIAPDGTTVATESVFKVDLPDGAHNSGPGDNTCDGVGIDDLAECGA
jgi:hypothetical protein